MRYITLHTGARIPVLGLGTALIGGSGGGRIRPDLRKGILGWFTNAKKLNERDVSAVQHAIEIGMTHIDTARLYGKGRSETLIGKAIKSFQRSDLFITSKVDNTLDYESVHKALEDSLARLDTSYLDMYLIHWPVSSVPIKETMNAFDDLIKKKLVRHIGVSNFSLEQLKEAQSHSKHKITTNQIKYNYLNAKNQKELLEYCQNNDIILTAYSPLDQGKAANDSLEAMKELMKKYQKTAAQIAINWLISQKNVIAIPKAVKIEHLDENIRALDFEMSSEDIKKLSV